MKLLFLIFVAYLAYRVGKSWLMRKLQGPAKEGCRDPSVVDVMVKDPVCGIYFPQREGVQLQHGGKTYVFCSAACREQFSKEQQKQQP